MTRPDIQYLKKLWLTAQERSPVGLSITFPTLKEAKAFRLRLHRAASLVRTNPGSDWAFYKAVENCMVRIHEAGPDKFVLTISDALGSDPIYSSVAAQTGIPFDGTEAEAEDSLKRLQEPD